ncbi:MaoC family dehydratase N-terminal domain-containing protein [Marinicaulis aureus]|uniref:MaoC family dehydratase N-terminal domain-containing protein n=1 Tax=Hyphococcus aureus TaxID=2666033 RepID=A0ABW1KXM6_9PROT
MIDRSFIGFEMEPFDTTLEKGQMELFAKALGEKHSIYSDEAVARAEGYPSIVALPTYLIRLGTRDDLTYGLFNELSIDLAKLLHGEQEFILERPLCAGETLRGVKKIVDIFDKKDGALEFVVTEILYHDENDRFAGSDRCTFVIRNRG